MRENRSTWREFAPLAGRSNLKFELQGLRQCVESSKDKCVESCPGVRDQISLAGHRNIVFKGGGAVPPSVRAKELQIGES